MKILPSREFLNELAVIFSDADSELVLELFDKAEQSGAHLKVDEYIQLFAETREINDNAKVKYILRKL